VSVVAKTVQRFRLFLGTRSYVSVFTRSPPLDPSLSQISESKSSPVALTYTLISYPHQVFRAACFLLGVLLNLCMNFASPLLHVAFILFSLIYPSNTTSWRYTLWGSSSFSVYRVVQNVLDKFNERLQKHAKPQWRETSDSVRGNGGKFICSFSTCVRVVTL
jgi:hypothetical protein